jgi:peroxiredoxin
MKNSIVIILLFWAGNLLLAQNNKLPATDLKTLNGTPISTAEIFETGNTTLLVFWKSTSGKCCENLEDLQNSWTESLEEKGVKMIAICVDCSGAWSHVKPLVAAKGWDFDTYIDVNGDFKRAMGVSIAPCTILLDKNLDQICRQNGFCAGSGEILCEIILEKLSKNKE